MSRGLPVLALGAATFLCALPAAADDADEIVVFGRGVDLIGRVRSGSEGMVGYEDFAKRPISRVGELVENVPGVIATQHSGTGKANQYFLRGFNLDHGTDFAAFADGVPVNFRSHGHGQGYLDLNFLIPELVERIDFRKGPYFADVGDFSGAGTVRFKTVDRLPRPFAQAVVGMYGYYRGVVAGSAPAGGGDLLVALDGTVSDGPWDLTENLGKANALVKWTREEGDRRTSILFSGYHAKWRSTDQVPERAIDSGRIGRFGNIDPTLGGETTRLSLSLKGRRGPTSFSAYGLYYDFRLTSNFTYFLDDPVNGDQFQQLDRRGVFGGAVASALPLGRGELRYGADVRYDLIDRGGLYASRMGVRGDAVREDKVDQYGGGFYAEAAVPLTPRLRAVAGVRGDVIGWTVRSDNPANSGGGVDHIFAPKAALIWRAADHLELYANYGEGLHSNDVRGATITVDPKTGEPAAQVPVIARARGAEAGVRIERGALNLSVVGFLLDLDSELVFVGDAGATEPNPASRRYGVEANAFWRPTKWLTIDAAYSRTHAHFQNSPGEDRIPNAVPEVLSAGVRADVMPALSASLRLRHFGAASLIEDDSARSDPTRWSTPGCTTRAGGRSSAWTSSTCSTRARTTSPISTNRAWATSPRLSPTGTFIRSNPARSARLCG